MFSIRILKSAVHNRHLFIAIINLQGYDILLIFLWIQVQYVKDHVWQIIHFAWSIDQLNKSGVSNEGQAAHHSFLNGTLFFFLSNHLLFYLSAHRKALGCFSEGLYLPTHFC